MQFCSANKRTLKKVTTKSSNLNCNNTFPQITDILYLKKSIIKNRVLILLIPIYANPLRLKCLNSGALQFFFFMWA